MDDSVFAVLSLILLSPDEPDAPLGGADRAALREADVVFSTLGDVDHDGGQFAAAEKLLADLAKPVLNPPSAVARTGRDQALDLFAGIENMIAPAVRRMTRTARACRWIGRRWCEPPATTAETTSLCCASTPTRPPSWPACIARPC